MNENLKSVTVKNDSQGILIGLFCDHCDNGASTYVYKHMDGEFYVDSSLIDNVSDLHTVKCTKCSAELIDDTIIQAITAALTESDHNLWTDNLINALLDLDLNVQQVLPAVTRIVKKVVVKPNPKKEEFDRAMGNIKEKYNKVSQVVKAAPGYIIGAIRNRL